MIKNDLLLKALRGEEVPRPPVWMMRQAGRYLPEYMKIRAQYDFFTRCQTPELASEITLQPIRRYGMDAAILFSDILVVPQAMNIEVQMKEGVGPWIPHPVRQIQDLDTICIPDINERLGYVMEAVRMTKEKLQNEIPLIGFAGSPWTIFCYVVQGRGSKDFSKAKKMCFTQPDLAHQLLQKITKVTILYLKEKIKAGVDVIQLFDSWGGLLSPTDYAVFSWPYLQEIIEALQNQAPVIVFAKGCGYALTTMADSGASALGVDWTIDPQTAREKTGNRITLQGNLDPTRLYSTPATIKKMVTDMIDAFGKDRYIVNLGHGILPDIPVENAAAFVEAVKSYTANRF